MFYMLMIVTVGYTNVDVDRIYMVMQTAMMMIMTTTFDVDDV